MTIATLTGDNGLLTKAGQAKNISEKANEKEKIQVEVMSAYNKRGQLNANKVYNNIKSNIKEATVTSTTEDESEEIVFPLKVEYNNGHIYQVLEDGSITISVNAGDKAPDDSNAIYSSGDYTAIIPAGFTVSNLEGESSIETGLVIRDDAGNEFVWIPVNIPMKSDTAKTIELGRYEFENSNNSTKGRVVQKKTDGSGLTPSGYSYSMTEETTRETNNNQNAVAKNINEFIIKTNNAGGFWIGRYEARTTSTTQRASLEDTLTTVTENPQYSVYNYIKQTDASVKARAMYDKNDYFESDLINSYAWDTAILFLQEYDNRTNEVKGNNNYKAKYSIQIRLSEGIKYTGTNASTIANNYKDKICNVYDMADNCWEWTTETSSNAEYPCVLHGGYCNSNSYYAGCRFNNYVIHDNYAYGSFRPILYVK